MSDISLEIHHLDVKGGDATVILVKDLENKKTLYSVLLDAGAEQNGSAFMQAYLKTHLQTRFDCMIATHYHDDHINGLSKKNSLRFTNFIDNGGYNDGTGKEPAPNGVGSGTRSDVFSAYQARIETHILEKKAKRIKIPFVNPTKDTDKQPFRIPLGHKDINLVCYSANGILADGQNVLAAQRQKKKRKPNPNDLSLAFVLEWDKFRYFTAGDLSGDQSWSAYYDIESSLVAYLTKEKVFPADAVSVFKASHHGSEHSNQLGLLALVNPSTIVVSVNQIKQVPSPIFLTRIKQHFGNPATKTDAKIVFSNRLSVEYGDTRFDPLQALQNDKRIVPNNIQSGTDGHDNDEVKCVVIRRRVKNGKPVPFDDVPAKGKDEHPGIVGRLAETNNAYEVVMVRRDKNEASKIKEAAKPKTFTVKVAWQETECDAKTIGEGFDDQAQTMAAWFKSDRKTKLKSGRDYVTMWFPAFVPMWNQATSPDNLEASVRPEMTRIFNLGFAVNTDGYFQPRSPKNLSARQRQTLFHLLWLNSRQHKLNEVRWPYDELEFWNETTAPEPYGTMVVRKRKPVHRRQSGRPTKRTKFYNP